MRRRAPRLASSNKRARKRNRRPDAGVDYASAAMRAYVSFGLLLAATGGSPMRPSLALGLSILFLPVLAALPFITAHSQTAAVRIDPPALDNPSEGLETVVLAGGCFWGVQAVYQHTKGVVNAVSGYAGGSA